MAEAVAVAAPVGIRPGAAGRIPGNKGIWVGITCELVEFALMFIVYFIARAHYPEAFHEGADRLARSAGTAITLLMVTSSWFIARSVHAMRIGDRRRSLRWLIAGLAVALGYPVVKALEVSWNLAHGIDGSAGVFVGTYYYLTLNHLVHASWGILGMVWVLARHLAHGYTAEEHSGLEALASYWHATDIIWLSIFSLFYVLA